MKIVTIPDVHQDDRPYFAIARKADAPKLLPLLLEIWKTREAAQAYLEKLGWTDWAEVREYK